MRIYIDTNTFPASPALYADAEKTKPLPRILPAVELQRGGFEVAFIGSNQPQDIATVALAASVEGTQTQVVAELGAETDDGEAWRFDFALNSESLVAEVANRGSARLRVGVIVEDDTERREWQFTTVVYPTASSGETDVEAVDSAKDWAELAEQSAKDAQEAQADVAGNAQLAENAKQTAMQAANAAIEAADNAEVAERNAAESKGAAEKAKTDAESAKTAAEKAASDAQATLANVYTKSEIDGVSTGAEVTPKMNEIHAMLKDYEEVTGEKLPLDFWEAVMEEFQRWQMNPNEVKEWVTTIDADGNVFSTCPYFEASPECVIDFNVVSVRGAWAPKYHKAIGDGVKILFLPVATESTYSLQTSKTIEVVIAPAATLLTAMAVNSKSPAKALYAPKTTQLYNVFGNNTLANPVVFAPKASTWNYALRGCWLYNRATDMRSANSADNAFEGTAMSAENVAKTLDSLPNKTDGLSHRIMFSRHDGTKLAPLMAESPYKESVDAAVAKGWTVQFD